MNIKIKDGRTDLFQWDTGIFLTVSEPCDYVHLANLQYGRAYTVKVVENEAMIPDELLQNGGNIYAYGFVGSPENGYTEQMQMFSVRRKPKPNDYVFTPTEQLSLQQLNDKIDEVASKQDPDAIKNAVDAIEIGGGGGEELEAIENLIDESGVLEDTEGSVIDKVEQVIHKAEGEDLWFKASSKMTSLASPNYGYFTNWKYSKLPRIDFSNITSLSYGFYNTQLESIDYYINSEICTKFDDALSVNKKLKWIVGVDLSSATTIFDLFLGCSVLETIQEPLNIAKVTKANNAFGDCLKLKDICFVSETIKVSISVPSANLSAESIQSIIDGLATVETAQTLTLNSAIVLTDEQKATIHAKGWTLAQ